MEEAQQIKISKFLSLVLRHKPEKIDLILNENGWAEVDELIEKANRYGYNIKHVELEYVVNNSDKKRFEISDNQTHIRANQGHSINIDLNLIEKKPPDILYHGTAEKNLSSIKDIGLLKGQRQHVHLSVDKLTAYKVGQRYGKPVILEIQAGQMFAKGIPFFESKNGVWLTEFIPSQFII